jgi:hypothetical protein
MGFRLNLYCGNIAHFQAVLGCRDERLVKQAFEWLEKYQLIYYQAEEGELAKHASEICLKYLNQIVFEGKIVDGLFPWKDYSWSFRLDEDDQDRRDSAAWIFLMKAVESLFALDESSFDEVSFYNQWHYKRAFQPLKASGLLNDTQESLWEYLLKGRSLDNSPLKDMEYCLNIWRSKYGTVTDIPYYGHLTNNELAVLVKGLNNFYLKVRLMPEKDAPPNWQMVMEDQFGDIYDDFVRIVESKRDIFFWTN